MKEMKHSIQYIEYGSMEELPKNDQEILALAISAAEGAYAPYSDFHVGSAIRLTNNTLIKGSNQENAAYPSGLCAERVAIFAASANYPNQEIETIAVYAKDSKRSNHVISPCGSCRQVISEYEHKQNKAIRILLMNSEKTVWEFKDIESLLPFSFKLKVLN